MCWRIDAAVAKFAECLRDVALKFEMFEATDANNENL